MPSNDTTTRPQPHVGSTAELCPARNPLEDFKESLGCCLAFSPRDWSQHHRDAWLWGIINGWDDDCLKELSEKHKWSSEDVQRLKRLREKFIAA